jgi:large subunit ribosomal protein L13
MGRLASFVAKKALLVEKVDIVNCENAIITGNKKQILSKYAQRKDRGIHTKGPFTYRMPDRFLRRVIRGMLPYKGERGKKAFKRIMCYIGVPERFKDKKLETVSDINVSKVPNLRYITVKDVCKSIGAKLK